MTSATRQYRRRLSTQPTTLHNEQLEPRQLMAAVADGHTECQSEHTSDMSVQSFTEMTSRVFGDSGASGLGGKEQSAKPGVNIGKIPLDEMMDHLHARGMNLDELIENLPRGVAELLGNPGDHAAFPQPGGSDVPQGEGLFGDWMNPGTDMNPNDPFGRGNNRDTMNDLLTTPTRDRLLFPGESGYEGDSGKDWSAMGSKQSGSGASLRGQLEQARQGYGESNPVGNCGSNAAFASLSQTYRCTVQTAIAGSVFGPQAGGALALGRCLLMPAMSISVDYYLCENSPDYSAPVLTVTVTSIEEGHSSNPITEGMARENETAITIRGNWNDGQASGSFAIEAYWSDETRSIRHDTPSAAPEDDCPPPDDPEGHRSGPQERSKPIGLSQGLVGQGNPEEISGGPRGRVYATPRGLELASPNQPTLMDMLGQPGRGDAGRTVGTHRGFSIDAVINPVPDEGWSAFGSKDS